MCGRYEFLDPRDPVMRQFGDVLKKRLPEEKYAKVSLQEVFPSQYACIGVYDRKRESFGITVMAWGFSLNGKLLINARSETIAEKRMFRDCYPCVIPASGYYEWSKERRKYHFTCEKKPLWLAGLCHSENGEDRFVILTEAAKEPEVLIHDRQPVILSEEEAHYWCKKKDIQRMCISSLNNRTMSEV